MKTSEIELITKFAQKIHLLLSSAQNLPYEEGDVCEECLIHARDLAALATPSVASPQDDPDPWIRPCPRIYSVQSDGSQVAYFNRQSAEQFISERKEPEKFKLIEYVPADGTERTRNNYH